MSSSLEALIPGGFKQDVCRQKLYMCQRDLCQQRDRDRGGGGGIRWNWPTKWQ